MTTIGTFDWKWEVDDKGQKNKEIKAALGELHDLFAVVDEIHVYQFGFILFYLPVYAALRAICAEGIECADNKEKIDIQGKRPKLNFHSWGSDKRCRDEAKNLPLLTESEKLSLNLFLAEPPSSIKWHEDQSKQLKDVEGQSENQASSEKSEMFTELPFITTFPLWGLSLPGNPKVTSIRQAKSKLTKSFSDVPFWEHFVDNLTMLNLIELENLSLSVSNIESTSFREVADKLATKPLVFVPNTKLDPDEDEFSFLFCGIADLVLTHQPWVGIRRGHDRKPPMLPQISYTHRWQHGRKPASALYFRNLGEKPDAFTKAFAARFYQVLKHACIRLNDDHDINSIQQLSRSYCDFVKLTIESHPKCHKGCACCQHNNMREQNIAPALTTRGCIEENAVGMQVCTSNQIFQAKLEERVDNDMIFTCLARELIGSSGNSYNHLNLEKIKEKINNMRNREEEFKQGSWFDATREFSLYFLRNEEYIDLGHQRSVEKDYGDAKMKFNEFAEKKKNECLKFSKGIGWYIEIIEEIISHDASHIKEIYQKCHHTVEHKQDGKIQKFHFPISEDIIKSNFESNRMDCYLKNEKKGKKNDIMQCVQYVLSDDDFVYRYHYFLLKYRDDTQNTLNQSLKGRVEEIVDELFMIYYANKSKGSWEICKSISYPLWRYHQDNIARYLTELINQEIDGAVVFICTGTTKLPNQDATEKPATTSTSGGDLDI